MERRRVSKEEVIEKLKDDGDFDNLRLKIIRKLKANEELRESIISTIRQSAAVNRAGAEKLKPRQLSDAIFDDVGDKLMSQISDGLWEIIRSGNGMKNEIAETVQSVYNKMVEPEKKEKSGNAVDATMLPNGVDGGRMVNSSSSGRDNVLSDNQPNGPPGFPTANHQTNSYEQKDRLQGCMPHAKHMGESNERSNLSSNAMEVHDVDRHVPTGFSRDAFVMQPTDGSDEDPDVPPGFG